MARWPRGSPGSSAPCSRMCGGWCSEGDATMSMEIKVPDIGDFKDVPVIEVHVQPGAKVAVDEPLVTLESDKATMDIPAPQAGTVTELRIKPGDRVSQGSSILRLEAEGGAAIPPKERIR